MLEKKYEGIVSLSKSNDNRKFKSIYECLINVQFYNKNKEEIREEYRKKELNERYRIKRMLYKSSLSGVKKNEIWTYLNQPKEI